MPLDGSTGLPVAIGLFIALWVVLGLSSVGVWLWGLIDACRRPDWAYVAARQNKTLWIVLIAVLGAIPAIIYLFAIRPSVVTAESAAFIQSTMAPPPGAPTSTLPRFCKNCGAGMALDARFCSRCAAPQ